MSNLDTPRAADTGVNTGTVHAVLRKVILAGELAPGRTLSQVQLAKQYGVSRIPVREALRRLQEEGLVEGERNHRLRVAPLSLTELEALYTQRILLESFGVYYTVPRLDEAALTSLEGTLGRMDNLGAKG